MTARPSSSGVRTIYCCQSCGHSTSKWLGRCPACGEWNSMVENAASPDGKPVPRGGTVVPGSEHPIPISEVADLGYVRRLACGLGEVDRVLGGGIVPGSLILLGGDPGIGKSTLLLATLEGLAKQGMPVLYVSGEESVPQVALRARRIGASAASLLLLAETNLERTLAHADTARPAILAIDSIQTIQSEALDGIPGSVGQVRECAVRLLSFAKQSGSAVILIGHVTKDGVLAGPKTLEHLVDVVLQFEGEGTHSYRILRGAKNRFGSTNEIGVFEMRADGLAEVLSPSELFLSERLSGTPGSVVVASADGARPILVELQALVASPSAGIGRRTAAGVDGNRVALLLAVLAERAGVDVLSQDVFVNVAGGIRLAEPALDLGIACAIASAACRSPVPPRTVVFGEVGLAGEIRAVSSPELRLAEAAKLGFEQAIMPRQNRARLCCDHGLEIIAVDHLGQALKTLWQRPSPPIERRSTTAIPS
ncbi:MAG: DNA repair protein RadA [Pseudomonadota bacterium]